MFDAKAYHANRYIREKTTNMDPVVEAVIQREALWSATSVLRDLRGQLCIQKSEFNKAINKLETSINSLQRQIERAKEEDQR